MKRQTRRTTLKRLVSTAPIAWVAPSIQVVSIPAHAQTTLTDCTTLAGVYTCPVPTLLLPDCFSPSTSHNAATPTFTLGVDCSGTASRFGDDSLEQLSQSGNVFRFVYGRTGEFVIPCPETGQRSCNGTTVMEVTVLESGVEFRLVFTQVCTGDCPCTLEEEIFSCTAVMT